MTAAATAATFGGPAASHEKALAKKPMLTLPLRTVAAPFVAHGSPSRLSRTVVESAAAEAWLPPLPPPPTTLPLRPVAASLATSEPEACPPTNPGSPRVAAAVAGRRERRRERRREAIDDALNLAGRDHACYVHSTSPRRGLEHAQRKAFQTDPPCEKVRRVLHSPGFHCVVLGVHGRGQASERRRRIFLFYLMTATARLASTIPHSIV